MIYTGRSVFTNKNVIINVEGETIKSAEPYDDSGTLPWISPGFWDIQVNGYNGIDYSLESLKKEQIQSLTLFLAKHGVVYHVPTFVSMPDERLMANLETLRDALEIFPEVRAAIPCVHLEGPFISPEDGPRGAHDKLYVRNPDFAAFERWQKAAGGLIRYVTLAPELPGAMDFIRQVTASGVKAAIGHCAASPEQIRAAVAAGASYSTHLGNGSHGMLPRLNNYVWEQIACDDLMAGIISDGFHLPPAVVKTIYRTKGLDKIVLVSDIALPGGYARGFYKWGNIDIEVFADGHLGVKGTQALAGAAHCLDWDLARFMEFTGASLRDAIKLCTINPARFLGFDTAEYDGFRSGMKASLSLFDYSDGKITIKQTVAAGRLLYDGEKN
jgi:N-acetylglucosamine-6-phosphate deacetylase